jgi:DNA-binding response OmpR family regulator
LRRESLNILLAEDDKNFGIILKSELEEEGYIVDLVDDGVKAVLNFIEKHYDLVLLDVKMPKLDGISAFRIMKKINPALSAIVFSGNAGYSEIEESLKIGVIRYFSKPFDIVELKECMRKYITT